mmetsp:Transcript_28507/g.65220  ORF Transcript_28507/g.65220 Transcript_28507/m.65220 type:complete len:300 (-) Transcript_28507:80-979(-)
MDVDLDEAACRLPVSHGSVQVLVAYLHKEPAATFPAVSPLCFLFAHANCTHLRASEGDTRDHRPVRPEQPPQKPGEESILDRAKALPPREVRIPIREVGDIAGGRDALGRSAPFRIHYDPSGRVCHPGLLEFQGLEVGRAAGSHQDVAPRQTGVILEDDRYFPGDQPQNLDDARRNKLDARNINQRTQQRLLRLGALPRQHRGGHNGHVTAHLSHCLRQLDAHGPASDHDQPRRNLAREGFEEIAVGPVRHHAQPLDFRSGGGCARADDEPLGRDCHGGTVCESHGHFEGTCCEGCLSF